MDDPERERSNNRDEEPHSKEEQPSKTGEHRRGHGGLILGLAVVLLLSGGVSYGVWSAYRRHQETQAVADRQHNFVPKVRVAEVKANDDVIKVSLPGNTLAFTAANIYARASGYIDKRNVDIGDHVKQGQLLAEIVAPELDHQISQGKATLDVSRANLQQAIANRDLAQITWNRDQPLVAKGWVTQQQGSVDAQTLKAQVAAVGVAQQTVSAQEAQLKVLEQQKDYQHVVAPFDGVVTQRNIDVGALVQADATTGTFMFTLMQMNVIRVQVYVPQDQAFGLKPGVEAVIRVPEFPDRTFPGKVTRIADALQQSTRTLLTEIDVPNPDGALSAGAYCEVELQIPRITPSFIVPSEAVVFDRDGLHVAVVENGTVHMQKIQVARDFGTSVEVQNGVKKGDTVILNPPVNLVQGSKVDAKAKNQGTPST